MNKANVVVGILAGVAVGALLGVLFAPDSGVRTRRKLSRKGLDAVDDLKSKFDEMLDEFTEKMEHKREEATTLYEKGKRKVEEFNRS
jgi:gas vesicle protein